MDDLSELKTSVANLQAALAPIPGVLADSGTKLTSIITTLEGLRTQTSQQTDIDAMRDAVNAAIASIASDAQAALAQNQAMTNELAKLAPPPPPPVSTGGGAPTQAAPAPAPKAG